VMLAFVGLIVATPYIALQDRDAGQGLQRLLAPTCHQLTERSLCVLPTGIGDCPVPAGDQYSRAFLIQLPGGGMASKFPVCARDLAIYVAMLIGGALFPFFLKMDSKKWPNKWILVAACIPIGIDGGTQLIGMRESTNLLRIITGVIVGIVLPFYLIPILNGIFGAITEAIERNR